MLVLQVEDRHQFTILAVTEAHEGRYTCAAENVLGQTDLVSYLTVSNSQVSITDNTSIAMLAIHLVDMFIPFLYIIKSKNNQTVSPSLLPSPALTISQPPMDSDCLKRSIVILLGNQLAITSFTLLNTIIVFLSLLAAQRQPPGGAGCDCDGDVGAHLNNLDYRRSTIVVPSCPQLDMSQTIIQNL